MAEKKVPMRTCIACRQSKPKKELIRIVRNKEGEYAVDRTGRLNGRGAYVCDDKSCFEKIIKRKLLGHAFECEVPAEVYDSIKEALLGEKE